MSKDGKPVAALVDAELFARIHHTRDRFDDLASRTAEDYAQTPVEIGLAEIDAAVAAQQGREYASSSTPTCSISSTATECWRYWFTAKQIPFGNDKQGWVA